MIFDRYKRDPKLFGRDGVRDRKTGRKYDVLDPGFFHPEPRLRDRETGTTQTVKEPGFWRPRRELHDERGNKVVDRDNSLGRAIGGGGGAGGAGGGSGGGAVLGLVVWLAVVIVAIAVGFLLLAAFFAVVFPIYALFQVGKDGFPRRLCLVSGLAMLVPAAFGYLVWNYMGNSGLGGSRVSYAQFALGACLLGLVVAFGPIAWDRRVRLHRGEGATYGGGEILAGGVVAAVLVAGSVLMTQASLGWIDSQQERDPELVALAQGLAARMRNVGEPVDRTKEVDRFPHPGMEGWVTARAPGGEMSLSRFATTQQRRGVQRNLRRFSRDTPHAGCRNVLIELGGSTATRAGQRRENTSRIYLRGWADGDCS